MNRMRRSLQVHLNDWNMLELLECWKYSVISMDHLWNIIGPKRALDRLGSIKMNGICWYYWNTGKM